MIYSINDISACLGYGRVYNSAASISQLVTDSRKINFPGTSLFFALKTSGDNGHKYIGNAYAKGIRNFVVSENIAEENYPGANFIRIENSLAALQKIAAEHRKKFSYPVIGITGSNGKTIVKEWLFYLLNNDYEIVRSPKSYNSQIGVPLAVWQMSKYNDLAIFEAGISQPGEMGRLQKIIDPEIGIFTFLGDAHAEGFTDRRQKISEKLKLFTGSKVLFYCSDETELNEEILRFKANQHPQLELFSWGKNKNASLYIEKMQLQQNGNLVSCRYDTVQSDFFIPFLDEASVHNAMVCIAFLCWLKFSAEKIAGKLLQLRPVEMRLELKQGINNCSLINDSYSADINSLTIALDFLEQQQQHEKLTVILSDFLQSGQNEDALYKNIASLLQQKKLFRFIGIGSEMVAHSSDFVNVPHNSFYPSTSEFVQHIHSLNFSNESILLKGARLFRFEKISSILEQKMHQTFLEIDLNAIRHNVKTYRRFLKPDVKLMCMVKAFSYGSGSFEIASLLQHIGVNYLGVAYADEGVELRKAGITVPIMVMNAEEAGFANMLQYKLEPELYSLRIFKAFRNYLEQQNISAYPVHIKIETGMHRLGFEEQDLPELCELLKTNECFKIQSVFSHLAAGGEQVHDAFTKQQAGLLLAAAATIKNIVSYPFIVHIANTSAIHRHLDIQMDMVRLGIGMYGIDSQLDIQHQLKNVTTLKTTISQIKKIKKGESVGYSRSAIAGEDKLIATVRIGYADGYPRILGNGQGYMLVNGQPAPVIGKICMDMTMIDITGIDAAEEDIVIVFGEALPVNRLAQWAQTIPYEMLTNISQRVRRVYFEE